MSNDETTVGEELVGSLAAKLEEFAAGLEGEERALLQEVLARGGSADDDEVTGFSKMNFRDISIRSMGDLIGRPINAATEGWMEVGEGWFKKPIIVG